MKESNAVLASTQRVLRADMNVLTSQSRASSAPQVCSRRIYDMYLAIDVWSKMHGGGLLEHFDNFGFFS